MHKTNDLAADTAVSPRKRATAEERAAILADFRAKGGTVAQYVRDHTWSCMCSASTIARWLREEPITPTTVLPAIDAEQIVTAASEGVDLPALDAPPQTAHEAAEAACQAAGWKAYRLLDAEDHDPGRFVWGTSLGIMRLDASRERLADLERKHVSGMTLYPNSNSNHRFDVYGTQVDIDRLNDYIEGYETARAAALAPIQDRAVAAGWHLLCSWGVFGPEAAVSKLSAHISSLEIAHTAALADAKSRREYAERCDAATRRTMENPRALLESIGWLRLPIGVGGLDGELYGPPRMVHQVREEVSKLQTDGRRCAEERDRMRADREHIIAERDRYCDARNKAVVIADQVSADLAACQDALRTCRELNEQLRLNTGDACRRADHHAEQSKMFAAECATLRDRMREMDEAHQRDIETVHARLRESEARVAHLGRLAKRRRARITAAISALVE